MSEEWLILDADYLCHRARYSLGMLSYQGSPTGVIYGMLNTVITLQKQFDTDKVVFCFDSRKSKRREVYPTYKAQRKNRQPMEPEDQEFESQFHIQIAKLRKDYLPQIGYRNIFHQSGYEADDLIAQAALILNHKHGCSATIVTADEDLFQCITNHIAVFNPHKKLLMSRIKFHQTYGIPVEAWVHVKAIAGCSSDNIKGVAGVGEKTAIKFLAGALQPNSKTYRVIETWNRTPNLHLVRLPYPGLTPRQLVRDEVTMKGWNDVCKALGFKSLFGGSRRHRYQRDTEGGSH